MREDLFDTLDKRKLAISSFTTLIKSAGWKLHEAIIQANIDILKQQILEGGVDEKELDKKREKLKAYEECMRDPETMIKKLEDTETEVPSVDPYDTVKPSKLDK